jgi:hypothetical protein
VDENFTQKRIAELSFDPERNTWFSFAQNFVSMKILFPEKNIGSKLDAGAWKGMRDELENIRNSSDSEKWERLSSLAMNMKILAAEKVEVTDKGLEITMPEKREGLESAPALPETKQF